MGSSARNPIGQIRLLSTIFSSFVMAVVVFCAAYNGVNWGVDFAGGVNIEIESQLTIQELRERLGSLSSVQAAERGVFLLKTNTAENVSEIKSALGHCAVYRKIDVVGPRLGSDLLQTFGSAIVGALVCMWLYIAYVFGAKFAHVGILGLVHDLVFILGLYVILGLEFDEFAIVGMLSTIGYSINDTIILFDAAKEKANNSSCSMPDLLAWQSILDTLRRTLLTSITTAASFLVLCFAGNVLFKFALPMLIGVVVGTYSSICLVLPYLSVIGGITPDPKYETEVV
jgi:preprotein translocase subunit SecF